MSTSLTFSVQTMEYDALDREIKRTMHRSAKNIVQLGFMLRQMLEKRKWAYAYSSFDEYLREELHLDYSMATRFININRKYSVSGNSMDIAERYEGYSQGLLIEMLNMPQELEEKVSPDMTVKQVREIKRQAKTEREAPVPSQTKETVIDGEYREIEEAEEGGTHDESWFVEQYVRIMPSEAAELFEICRKERNNSDRAKAIQKHIAPYGCHGTNCSEYSFTFHGFAGGMDFQIGGEKMNLKYGRFVVELMKLLEKEVATSQPEEKGRQEERLSPYGLPKTVYPEGSLLTTVGCGHKHDCFSCSQDCAIRQEDRHCVEAPLGNPFPCTTMHVLGNIRSEIGGQCQFINLDISEHTAGSNEPDPCCKRCNNASCGYRCEKSRKLQKAETEGPNEENEGENVPEGRIPVLKYLLEQRKSSLNFYLKSGCLSEAAIRRDKSIVETLSDVVCDLEAAETAPAVEEVIQPELPVLKNNDQRKRWLAEYKAWGIWYRDENIDVNYYKYDFSDGSRLVVAEYPQRHSYYSSEYEDEHCYHLLEKNKKGYKKPYDEKYRQQTDSETYLVEFLKNLQKKG